MTKSKEPQSKIVLYVTENGRARLQVRLDEGTVWLPQRLLAELYETSVPNINQHISSIYEDGELAAEATIKKCLIVQTEGGRQISRQVGHCSEQSRYPVIPSKRKRTRDQTFKMKL